MNTTTPGVRVVRTEGRPADIGRKGTVVRYCPPVVGSAGADMVVVNGDDGSTWTAYPRQLKVTA